jgi:hypothetical protein
VDPLERGLRASDTRIPIALAHRTVSPFPGVVRGLRRERSVNSTVADDTPCISAHPGSGDAGPRPHRRSRFCSVDVAMLNGYVKRSSRAVFRWRTALVYWRSTVWNGTFSSRSTASSCPPAVARLSTIFARNNRAAAAASVLRTFRLGWRRCTSTITGTMCLGSGKPTSSGSAIMLPSAKARRSRSSRSNGPDRRLPVPATTARHARK